MPRVTILVLDEAARITLAEMRDHHPKAYLRERAAALLKVAAGWSIQAVVVQAFLDQFRQPSPALLHYVGLPV